MSSYSRRSIQKYNPFELVVDTNIVGDSGVGNFILRPNPSGSYRYYVEWGDGSVSASTTSTNLTHSYSLPGIYNVNVYGRFDGIFNNNSNEADKILDVLNWGNIKWRFFSGSFYGCANLTGLTATPPIFNVVNSSFLSVFNGASNFNQDIGSWDVSNVNNIGGMFFQATNFNNGGSPSISGWTTSACTSMSDMFRSATSFNQPIGSWNVSGVTNMSTMFQLATNFNQDIGSWDVSNVQFMNGMFASASNFNKNWWCCS
jgi:surface protein